MTKELVSNSISYGSNVSREALTGDLFRVILGQVVSLKISKDQK